MVSCTDTESILLGLQSGNSGARVMHSQAEREREQERAHDSLSEATALEGGQSRQGALLVTWGRLGNPAQNSNPPPGHLKPLMMLDFLQ